MFRIIPNYNNYEVSENGILRNVKTKKELKTWDTNGYEYCRVINENGHYKIGIHRLIGITWIDNPDNLPVIDHIDRNKKNNHISNLRWVSFSENSINKNIPIYNQKDKELHHITKGYGGIGFVVGIQRNLERIQKYFNTLEKAIEFRNENL